MKCEVCEKGIVGEHFQANADKNLKPTDKEDVVYYYRITKLPLSEHYGAERRKKSGN